MIPVELELDADQVADKLDKLKERPIKTNVKLFTNHNGLRPNKMHLFMAPTGVGKSTFVRTLTIDFLKNNPDKKMLIWLTEETIEDFEDEFSNCVGFDFKKHTGRLNITSEQDLTEDETADDVKKQMKEMIEKYDYDLVVLDNITTSRLCLGKSSGEQEKSAAWLKSFCKKNLALFVVAHTGGAVQESSNRLLDENDIRGNKTLVNLTEFLYILQPFRVKNLLFQFLVTKKSRGQEIKSRYIGVEYNKYTRTFSNDAYVDFEELKEIFKKRNRLDG